MCAHINLSVYYKQSGSLYHYGNALDLHACVHRERNELCQADPPTIYECAAGKSAHAAP